MDETPLTVNEVCTRLRCSTTYVYKLYRRGDLEGFRNGKSIRILPSSLTRYFQRNRNQPRLESAPLAPVVREQTRKLRAPAGTFRHLKFQKGTCLET